MDQHQTDFSTLQSGLSVMLRSEKEGGGRGGKGGGRGGENQSLHDQYSGKYIISVMISVVVSFNKLSTFIYYCVLEVNNGGKHEFDGYA